MSSKLPAQVPMPNSFIPSLSARFSRDWLWGLILVLAVFLAYQPVWHAGFIWDDDSHITANPVIIGPLGLKEIWTTSQAQYYPLALTTFWAEHALWGLAPLPYHIVNVLMHGACAVVLWLVLRGLQAPGAWLGAALWALHPVQVESVAWITEMKNTQSCLFYLLTILFFVTGLKARDRGDGNGSARNVGLTLLFAALAMASKSSTLVLPMVLGLCAWWVEGRWQWRSMARVGPFALMAIIAASITLWTQALMGVNGPQWARSLPERLATSGDVVWFYLGKLLWPHPLIFIYPRWEVDTGSWLSYLPLAAVVIVLLLLWRIHKAWARACFFAFAYFLCALLPVSGIVDGYFWRYSLVGDHFQYLADMGPLALAATALTKLADVLVPEKLRLQSFICAGLLLTLGLLSWQRAWVFRDPDTLWTDTLAKNPNCWMAHNNFGLVLDQEGRIDEAIAHYHKAMEIRANGAEFYNNLGNALVHKGQIDEAIAQYQRTVEIDPNYARAYNNLGDVLSQKKGRIDEGILKYQQALEIDPTYVEARCNLGLALVQKGRIDEAIDQYQKALGIAADHNDLGIALNQKGRVEEALFQYKKALEIFPGYAEAHNNLGNLLNQKGDVEEAIAQYQKALEINSHYAEAYNNLGVTLLQKGEVDRAAAQFEKALEYAPDYGDAHYGLGYALMQKGRLDDAVIQFREVVRLNPGDRDAQNNLARARALARQASGPKN